jgi:hypothetical protein
MKLNDNLNNILQSVASSTIMNNGTAFHHSQAIPLSSSINLPGIGVINSNTAAALSNMINSTNGISMLIPSNAPVSNNNANPATANINDTLLNDLIQLQQKQQLEIFLREFLTQQHQLLKLQQQQQQQFSSSNQQTQQQPIDLVNNINSSTNGPQLHVPSINLNHTTNGAGIIPIAIQPVTTPNSAQSSVAIAAAAIASMASHLPPVAASSVANSSAKNQNQGATEAARPQYARIEIDYSNVKNLPEGTPRCTAYTVNTARITFGRRINNGVNSRLSEQQRSTNDNTEIFIENSTLISRKHFTLELDEMDAAYFEANCKAKLDKTGSDFECIEEESESTSEQSVAKSAHSSSGGRIKYWKLYCVSKNGIFINARYIQTGKYVRLFGKSFTFRFPNTNIRIAFESVAEASSINTNGFEKVSISF